MSIPLDLMSAIKAVLLMPEFLNVFIMISLCGRLTMVYTSKKIHLCRLILILTDLLQKLCLWTDGDMKLNSLDKYTLHQVSNLKIYGFILLLTAKILDTNRQNSNAISDTTVYSTPSETVITVLKSAWFLLLQSSRFYLSVLCQLSR
jgi:hypothetical protein